MVTKYQEKKKALQTQLQQKVEEFQKVENVRTQLTTEIVELRGQIKMLEELISEEEPKKEEPK